MRRFLLNYSFVECVILTSPGDFIIFFSFVKTSTADSKGSENGMFCRMCDTLNVYIISSTARDRERENGNER